MTDNDYDGERELVLGNRQLLGIFFVAMLLCGVFFAMGYVVGGNSAKAGAATAAADTAPVPVTEGKRQEPQPAPQATMPAAENPAPTDSVPGYPPPEPRMAENPAAVGAQPGTSTPLPQSSKIPPPAPTDTAITVAVPESGSYWQVTAASRPGADVIVKQLRDRQFPAILAKSSRPELFEVLVGPYRSPVALADAKKKLIDLSFDGLILHKQ